MTKIFGVLTAFVALAFATVAPVAAKGTGGSNPSIHGSTATQGVTRDSHGAYRAQIIRSCLSPTLVPLSLDGQSSGACPGCVVDHVVPLKRGGRDDASNMQWQTPHAAKEKDRYSRAKVHFANRRAKEFFDSLRAFLAPVEANAE